MLTKLYFTTSLFLLVMAMPAFAEDAHNHNPADHQHGSEAEERLLAAGEIVDP